MELVYQNKSVWNSMQMHTACDSSHKGKCWLLLLIGISLVTLLVGGCRSVKIT